MAFMQLSEKAKRFWAFLVSFTYPALVLMGANSLDTSSLELGFSGDQLSWLVNILLIVPILILIYFNIKFARQINQESKSKTAELAIRWQDECLSLVLISLLFSLPIGLFGFLDFQIQGVHWPLFNFPSFLMIACCFAFMLVINGGHTLRWLYQHKGDVLVRYNHHLKAGSAYTFAGMLGTGIGLVQIITIVEDIHSLFPAYGIAALTSLYGLVFFAHHLLCRMWVYAHDDEAPCLIDLNGIFLSVGPAFTTLCLIALWGAQSLSSAPSGDFGWMGDLFVAYGVSDWDQGIETIYHQLLPIALGLAIFLLVGFLAVSLFLRRRPMVRPIHESTWIEFIFSMGAIYLISFSCISAGTLGTAEAGLALVSIGIVALAFFTGIGMCHIYLNFQSRWADAGVISVKQSSPHLLNYFHAPYFWNLTAMAAALMGGGSIYQPGYILLGVVVLFLVGQSQFKKNRLERIIGTQTDQLQRDKLALETLDKQKTNFFQTISHELRTPLTLIMSPLERRLEVHPGQEELLIASNNAKRLLRLVNQLLDFQKASAGRFELNLRPRSLAQLVLRCADYFRSAASGRGIRFSVTQNGDFIEKSKAVIVAQLDSDGFEKVVMNFLSNALKYTPPGGEIELGFLVRAGKVRVFVRDSGPGIPAEAHESLFEIFTQVDGSTTREFEGTGIGLALCKDLSEGMGGAVGVESQVGQGSTFWADFPQVFDEPEDEFQSASDKTWMVAGDETQLEEADEEQSDLGADDIDLILVVDDNSDMRRMVKASALDMGYRVVTAEDGQAGLDAAKEHMPDLIVSDWMMPNMSGPEMVTAIREDETLRGIPVVMLTAKSDEESKLVGTGVGADAFLGKPFNKVELSTTIRNLLQLKSGEKEIKRLNEYLTESVCKRYLPVELVQEILDGKLSMEQPAQLRQVTILFSDLKGFTATSERLGPEGISEILNEYLSVMNEVIFEHGGTIDKFIGDAIMVIFGAPKDMDDSEQAERAAQCALAMNQAMAELSSRWEKFDASHLCMRIGIHQGPAVVGNFGSQRRSDYTCIGPTVNFAARIESAAQPGSVYASSAVKAHLPEAGYESAGEFELKGLDQPQTLYRLVDA